jgi:hypothetical protein
MRQLMSLLKIVLQMRFPSYDKNRFALVFVVWFYNIPFQNLGI